MAEAPVNDLYQARVAISDRSAASRQAAYRQGLAQVLVKVSGFSGTPDFEGLQAELASAEQYLLEFSIESMAEPTADGVAVQEGEALWMRFNQAFIDELIRRWEIPIWPSSRPEVGIALEVTMGAENILLDESHYPAAAAMLQQNAARRGIHLQVLAPEDAGLVLTGGSNEVGAGYDYWGILAMQEDRFGDSHVSLQIESEGSLRREYLSQSPNLWAALAEVVDLFVDQASLQASFIAAAASGSQVMLELSGIQTFENYQRALDSLKSLEMVDEATVLQLDLNRVQMRVRLASNLTLLLDGIEQQGVLQIEQGGPQQTAGYPLLRLRYRGGAN